jgi:hypothetical protein
MEETSKKLEQIWKMAKQRRKLYNQKMIDRYAKTHNIFEYVLYF